VHARRLHGFALILTMGERQLAARASTQALTEAIRILPELRHPERAAAWLRHIVLNAVRKARPSTGLSSAERSRALTELGIGLTAMVGLEALSVLERAALVASDVERLSPIDVELVVGRSPNATRLLVHSARRRFVAVAMKQVDVLDLAGPVSRRIEEVAARTVAPGLAR
jgi:hypothetical protein